MSILLNCLNKFIKRGCLFCQLGNEEVNLHIFAKYSNCIFKDFMKIKTSFLNSGARIYKSKLKDNMRGKRSIKRTKT